MADMNRDAIIVKARQLVGVTDPTKGGPADSDLYVPLTNAIDRFALEAAALKTVMKLSTKASDKYLPMVDEIHWPIQVSFVDTDGRAWPLGVLEVAPRPGMLGTRPENWWLTAVNVPDVSGRSTPTLGINPYVNYDGNGNVIVECIQSPKDLSLGTDIPELVSSLHSYIADALALEMLPMFPERMFLEPMLERRRSRGIAAFKALGKADFKTARGGHDVMRYRARARARF